MLVTAAQIRAARGLLNWNQQELAAACGLSLSSIRRMEGPDGTGQRAAANVEAVRLALEGAGVIFQAAGATPTGGPGVRLKE